MTRVRASIVILILACVVPVASPSVARAQAPTRVQTAGREVAVVADRLHGGGPDLLGGARDLEAFRYATNASFWVKSLPIIPYFPFFAAPIRRERESGFLPPQLGTSARKGFFAEVPFYWAISDSQDATLTLDAYEKRGFGG